MPLRRNLESRGQAYRIPTAKDKSDPGTPSVESHESILHDRAPSPLVSAQVTAPPAAATTTPIQFSGCATPLLASGASVHEAV